MERRKPYPTEFKQEAVKLVTEQGMGVTHAVRMGETTIERCRATQIR